MKCTAIVLAAGQGKRMNSKIQKQFLQIKGKPVLYYSLACFQNSPDIDEIIVVTGKESINFCKQEIIEAYGLDKVRDIVPGGKERYDSVYNGLCVCDDSDYVFIHDGARPFITRDIIHRSLEGAIVYGACAAGMPAKDTVKIVNEQGIVVDTPKRSLVWNIQTPQVFACPAIRKAHEEARKNDMSDITDDAMIMERFGEHKVKLVEGAYDNIKITTPDDILLAEKILEKFEN